MSDFEKDDEEIIYVSKSELKRDSEALQDLGNELIELTASQLKTIPLDEDLLEAIELAQRIRKKHEAFRRQRQYIGKLMRARDPEPIQQALDKIKNRHALENAKLHLVEQWRDKLVDGDNAQLQAFIEQYPQVEIQRLRQLVRQTKKEKAANKAPKSYRELFQLLKGILTD
ncbi:ribosome biogenesis factor YjgA [Gallaecimonas sp. GXIMD4217]|uniref:ribosome biogenesis factor YjgA n=1 Tax=Gallaecimonas sp. GXIMD4217 TaxID=3131927 RepID=UPI00311B251F